jgi:RHH-type proline utilization regulon transcriptional repressor/proline dehydrogenase/delta 1-pyrroline-5-carboxylate dehydrogenase
MAGNPAGRRALGAAAAAGVRHMAHRFIVGASPKDAIPILRGLWNDGIASSVDLLGEATVTQPEADRYAARCAEALDVLAGAYARLSEQPQLEADRVGPLPRANLSVKVSALTPLLRPEAPEVGKRDAASRLRGLLQLARDLHAHLHIHRLYFPYAQTGTTGEEHRRVSAAIEAGDAAGAEAAMRAHLSAARLRHLPAFD